MARMLATGADWIGVGTLTGRLYDAGGYPGLVMGADAPAVVGDLYQLCDPAAMLAMLDAYEEAGPDFPAPQEYARSVVPVATDGGDLDAWVYIYNWPVEGLAEWTPPPI